MQQELSNLLHFFYILVYGFFGGITFRWFFCKTFTKQSIMIRRRVPIALNRFPWYLLAFRGHAVEIRLFSTFFVCVNPWFFWWYGYGLVFLWNFYRNICNDTEKNFNSIVMIRVTSFSIYEPHIEMRLFSPFSCVTIW